MSIPTTDGEWAALFSQTAGSLKIPSQPSDAPRPSASSIPGAIDHTLLALSATEAQVDTLCQEAREHSFATVCVRVNFVPRAISNLKGSPVGVACVVGFHEGTHSTAAKVQEAQEAVSSGASELDMVLNYPLLKAGQYRAVYEDVRAVRQAAPAPVGLKVILETSQLSHDEIAAGSLISCLAGADFVKTSTGFNGAGANVENVALMKAVVDAHGKGVKVKASGGVRTADDCIKMLQAGAERIGASAGVKIVKELKGDASTEGVAADGY